MNLPPPAPSGVDTSTRAEAAPLSVFGNTVLEAADSRQPRARTARVPVFDLCHPGVMLRALLLVHGVLALGTCFFVDSFGQWWPMFAAGSAQALPGILLWLSVGCLAQRPLDRLRPTAQTSLAVAWGAACALLPWWGWQALQLSWAPPLRMVAVAATGAVLAAAFIWWLRQRAQARVPAATTARLAELQSRIRPHFLFNTLNTAIALVRVDPARAEAVLEDLSELFRAALADADAGAATTLADEVDLARRYLAIEQLRFGDRLDVRWELDPAADAARLPPLLLQPLLENAVRHGVEPSPTGGQIRVRTRVRRGQVEIAVVNTVPAAASIPGHGIALRNVRERLILMHDVAADFRARREADHYRVDVTVPL